MIKTITLTLTAIILFASCGSKFSLMKRKYTKGYYISTSKGHKTTGKESLAKTIAHQSKTLQNDNVDIEVIKAQTEPQPIKINHSPSLTGTFGKTQAQQEKRLTSSVSKPGENHLFKKHPTQVKPLVLSKSNSIQLKKDDTSDIRLVLLVILCLFWWLDLLAVFIHDNQAITPNFWITLLLDLLVVPGIVFAILVVLNIVDVK